MHCLNYCGNSDILKTNKNKCENNIYLGNVFARKSCQQHGSEISSFTKIRERYEQIIVKRTI